ncbi:hypothetical protein RRG08_051455 [Elysia crispata]|uniref:Uncharacterized protein n=1 Tax=Elysia crispata TaxID=231223 RepID=A0AAE1CMW5_9GAST|nr:hypothetical protein RRG08_051455 [Elysia crispata]
MHYILFPCHETKNRVTPLTGSGVKHARVKLSTLPLRGSGQTHQNRYRVVMTEAKDLNLKFWASLSENYGTSLSNLSSQMADDINHAADNNTNPLKRLPVL